MNDEESLELLKGVNGRVVFREVVCPHEDPEHVPAVDHNGENLTCYVKDGPELVRADYYEEPTEEERREMDATGSSNS